MSKNWSTKHSEYLVFPRQFFPRVQHEEGDCEYETISVLEILDWETIANILMKDLRLLSLNLNSRRSSEQSKIT